MFSIRFALRMSFILSLLLFTVLSLNPPVYAQTQLPVVSGTITLEGIAGSLFAPEPINFEFSLTTNASTVFVATATLTASGAAYTGANFSFTTVPPGVYNVGIKGRKWLRATTTVTVPTTGAVSLGNISLTSGDANNDNSVDNSDSDIVIDAYGSNANFPDSGYDARADLNCDGLVDISDLNLLTGDYSKVGILYQVSLGITSLPSATHIALQWSLLDLSGTQMPTPSGTTFRLYRSTSADYVSGAYITVPANASATLPYANTYTDTVTDTGPRYYQVIAILPGGGYGLSNEVSVASNPLIENLGQGIYRITGFQTDRTTRNYQATVTNGLLNSYNINGRELFHANPSTGANLPIQFAQYVPPYLSNPFNFHMLAEGLHSTHSLPSMPYRDFYTLKYTFSDAGNLTTNITYAATPTSFQAIMQPNYNLSFCLPLGCEHDTQENEDVVAAQNLAVAGQGYYRPPGTGTTHALPVPLNQTYYYGGNSAHGGYGNTIAYSVDSIRNLRCLFNDGSGVDVTYALNDPGYIEDEGHIFTGQAPYTSTLPYSCWGRDFGTHVNYFAQNVIAGYIQFTLSPVAAPVGLVSNPAPPFHLYVANSVSDLPAAQGTASYDSLGFHAKTAQNQLYCQIQINPGLASSLSGNYTFSYTFTDFWNRIYPLAPTPPFSRTFAASSFNTPSSPGIVNFSLPLPADSYSTMSGWFRLTGSLAPSNAGSNLLLDQDEADFGVYNLTGPTSHVANGPVDDMSEAFTNNGSNFGHSDPGVPVMSGMQANRVDSNIVITVDPTLNAGYVNKLEPRDESAIPSTVYNRLATFTDVTGAQPDEITLVGSVVPTSNGASQSSPYYKYFNTADVAFTMAANLNTVPSGTTQANSPIQYWSLGNEPRVYDAGSINQYVKDELYPGTQAIHKALYTPNQYNSLNNAVTTNQSLLSITPKRPPVIMAPNPVNVELSISGQGPLSWWDAFFASQYTDGSNTYNAAHLLDAISTHTYTGDDRSWEEQGVPDSLNTLQGKIAQAPGGLDAMGIPKPLWITEHGWPWIDSGDMQRFQGAYTARRYAQAAAHGIPHNHDIYYYGADIGFAGNFQYLWNGVPNRGGMAMRIFNEMTGGMHYDNIINITATGKYVHAIPYTDGTNETLVVWGNDFTDLELLPGGQPPVSITLSVPFAIHVYNLMGNEITPTPINTGRLSYAIPATGSPVYVCGQKNGLDFVIANGWPTLQDRTNYALAANGGTPGSSPAAGTLTGVSPATFRDLLDTDTSLAPAPYYAPFNNDYFSGGVAAINDGVWGYDDRTSNGQPDGKGNPTKLKTMWIGGQTYPTSNPDFVQVIFATAKTINTLVAVVPSSNNSTGGTLCGARDYRFQVTTDGTNWLPIQTVTGNTMEWVLHATLQSQQQQNIKGVRLIIDNVNNGRWYNDYNSYTDFNRAGTTTQAIYGSPLRAMVYELEAYGPTGQ